MNAENKYSLFNKGNIYIFHQREIHFLSLLKHFKIFEIKDKKILDVGCGSGIELLNLIKFGASPERLFGIDIRAEAIFKAKHSNKSINFILADAEHFII